MYAIPPRINTLRFIIIDRFEVHLPQGGFVLYNNNHIDCEHICNFSFYQLAFNSRGELSVSNGASATAPHSEIDAS